MIYSTYKIWVSKFSAFLARADGDADASAGSGARDGGGVEDRD